MEDYNYKEALEELRNRYKDGKVSAFIGAGFSKNVYKDYPSWDELLFDMVCELYDDEISQSYKIECAHSPKFLKRTPISEYKKEQVYRITKREGYLNIVSQYVERKGYREALETYLEAHIPDLKGNIEDINTKGEILLQYKGRKDLPPISVKGEDFETHVKLLSGNWHSIYTTNYDRLIEIAKKIGKKHIKVITEASNLELEKDIPSLIKLHGSFLDDYFPTENFEFDGSHRHRYIMTKEDYETYPQEHEAFTQLMRISLLQGTFCLFGFSGEDPNFLAWIKWVRDILVRYKNRENSDPLRCIKIFLFDISDKEPSRERRLFYKNHNICHIPLLSEEVKSIITPNSEVINHKLSIREIFLKLFHYLDNASKKYNEFWASVINNTNKVEVNIEDLKKAKKHQRIISDTHYQKFYILDLGKQTTLTRTEIDLFILALNDTFYLPSFCDSILKNIHSDDLREEQKNNINLLRERELTLNLPKAHIKETIVSSDELNYEYALRLSFSLSFSQLKRYLEGWSPEKGIFMVKKAILLSLFNVEKAKGLLQKSIYEESIPQERYFGKEQLRILDFHNRFGEKYNREQNQDIEDFYKLKSVFFDLETKESKVKPLGPSSKTYSLDNQDTNRFSRAFRALQFLIELPLFTSYHQGYFIAVSSYDWLSVFKPLFEDYPYPCLFYSVLYHDKDFLTRIGQEYAFSEALHEEKKIDRLLLMMLNSILDKETPPQISDSLMLLSSELFISVPTDIWQATFLKIWKTKIFPHYDMLLEGKFDSLQKFTIKAISKIKDKLTLEKLALDFLSYTKKTTLVSAHFFYHTYEIRKVTNSQLSSRVKNKVALFTKNITSSQEVMLANNIINLLSTKDKVQIKAKVQEFLTNDEFLGEGELLAISYWLKEDINRQTSLKKRILNHPKLWDTGVMKDGMRGGPISPLKLYQFEKNILWKETEIKELFNKLNIRVNELIAYYQSKAPVDITLNLFIHENEVLIEMEDFLIRHQDILKNNNNYNDTLKTVQSYLIHNIGSIDAQSALLSDNEEFFDYGYHQILNKIKYAPDITDIYEEIDMIIYRVLYKKELRLFHLFQIISFTLENSLKTKRSFKRFSDNILSILSTYKQEDLFDLNLNIYETTKIFIKIAENLRGRGLSSDGIDYWLGRKDRFNFTWN